MVVICDIVVCHMPRIGYMNHQHAVNSPVHAPASSPAIIRDSAFIEKI